jgi:mono/diheme cytochrome c family protein
VKLSHAAAGALALIAMALAAPAQDFAAGKFAERSGEAIWKNVCQGCHMPEAQGATSSGEYPALAKNPRMASGMYAATVVLQGRRGMPQFGPMLDDEQIANVVNYVRTNFGNRYRDAVTPAQVAALRGGK